MEGVSLDGVLLRPSSQAQPSQFFAEVVDLPKAILVPSHPEALRSSELVDLTSLPDASLLLGRHFAPVVLS